MKRVHIKTAGKMISFQEYRGIRTPTFIDIEEKDLDSWKMYATIMGIDNCEITDTDNKFVPEKRQPKTGLKTILTSGGGKKNAMKLNVK